MKANNLVRHHAVAILRAVSFVLALAGTWMAASTPALAVDLPRVLSEADAAAYRQIFTLISQQNMGGAARLAGQISDKRLLGHVFAQRYLHPTAYRSSYGELRQWLDQYADYPQAGQIYALALRKRGADAPPPRRPAIAATRYGTPHEKIREYRSPAVRSKAAVQQVAVIQLHLKGLLKKSGPDAAYSYLQSAEVSRRLDAVERDIARLAIAQSYFGDGRDQDALQLASEAAARNGKFVPQAHWTAGLAAWRLGRIDQSATHFSVMADAQSPYAAQASLTAAAYWAARAHLAARQPQKVNQYLQVASRYPQTLYGMLAYRQLGLELPFDWSLPQITEADVAALERKPGFLRMLALREAGQLGLADKELQLLHSRLGPDSDARLLAVAGALKLPRSQIKIAETARINGHAWMAGLYPVPDWRPQGGFTVDPALLFAIARKESNFIATAEGSGGARGLMQLMPTTAKFVSRARGLHGVSRDQMFDPEFNLALGQHYLKYLRGQTGRGDLLSVVAAYNVGPGVVEIWQKRARTQDTLLFLESLPNASTRNYVTKVVADFWIYQHQMGTLGNSLDAVAQGGWPKL